MHLVRPEITLEVNFDQVYIHGDGLTGVQDLVFLVHINIPGELPLSRYIATSPLLHDSFPLLLATITVPPPSHFGRVHLQIAIASAPQL